MHKSRFGGLIIDCQTNDLDAAAEFWGAALGHKPLHHAGPEDGKYRILDTPAQSPYLEVQQVKHPSRVHLDIETDDIEAEVRRLQTLGAKRLTAIRDWVVMEAPTGQRFCVVPARQEGFETGANTWS